MTRDELHSLIWHKPLKEIGARFGASREQVLALAAFYEIPMPGRDHWPKQRAAVPCIVVPELPPHSRPERLPAVFPFRDPPYRTEYGRRTFISPRPTKRLHPIAAATRNALRPRLGSDVIEAVAPGTFPLATTQRRRDEAMTFVDTLLKECGRHGLTFSVDDGFEINAHGVWFSMNLRYGAANGSIRLPGQSETLLYVQALSPADRVERIGMFRRDVPDTCFNGLFFWLYRTALAVRYEEDRWSKTVRDELGTTEDRFAARRAAARVALEQKAQAERAEKAAADPKLRARDASTRLDAMARRVRADPASAYDVLREVRAEQTKRTVEDASATMTKQEGFLWIVQTALLFSMSRARLTDAEEGNWGTEMTWPTTQVLTVCGQAFDASRRIPGTMTSHEAASDFLEHTMPETAGTRAEPDYDTPEWLGFDTKAEAKVTAAVVAAMTGSG